MFSKINFDCIITITTGNLSVSDDMMNQCKWWCMKCFIHTCLHIINKIIVIKSIRLTNCYFIMTGRLLNYFGGFFPLAIDLYLSNMGSNGFISMERNKNS